MQPTAALPPLPAAPAAMVVLLRRWHRLECGVAVWCFGFIAAVLVLDVLGREIVGPLANWLGVQPGAWGLLGAQKLAIFALVMGSYCGIGIATASGAHLVPRIGFRWIPRDWGPAMDRLADLVSAVILLGVAWFGVQFVLASQRSGVLAPVINLSAWPIQAMIPLGFASASLRYVFFAVWPGLRPGSAQSGE